MAPASQTGGCTHHYYGLDLGNPCCGSDEKAGLDHLGWYLERDPSEKRIEVENSSNEYLTRKTRVTLVRGKELIEVNVERVIDRLILSCTKPSVEVERKLRRMRILLRKRGKKRERKRKR